MEKTFVLIKPDGVQRALMGKIIGRFEDAGLRITAMKMAMADKELARPHYVDDVAWLEDVGEEIDSLVRSEGNQDGEHRGADRPQDQGLPDGLPDLGPVVAMVMEGNEALSIVRKIVGSTAPSKADPSTLRGMYAIDSYQLADEQKRPVRQPHPYVGQPGDGREGDRPLVRGGRDKGVQEGRRAGDVQIG